MEIYKMEPGPILVLAGPGTGKTETLARRAKYLVEEKGVPHEEITIITFTRSATFETLTRISDQGTPERKSKVFLPPENQPHISTMHKLGHKVISKDDVRRKRWVGLKEDFRVEANDDLLMSIMEDASQINGFPRKFAKDVTDCRIKGNCVENENSDKCKVCLCYKNILRKSNAIDFAEQIILACKVFEKLPDVLKKWQQQTRHLLVDEYQDINPAQFKMIKYLSQGQENGLFVVGDDDQSIYRWRGGSPDFIRNFLDEFKEYNPHEVSLPTCHRCPEPVHKAALVVMEKYDSNRRTKEIVEYKNDYQTKVHVKCSPSEISEAKFIARMVRSKFPAYNSLILVPKWSYTTPIKTALRKVGLPYDLPFDLKEIFSSIFEDISIWLKSLKDLASASTAFGEKGIQVKDKDSKENLITRNMIRLILEGKKIKEPAGNAGIQRWEEWDKKMLPISNLWLPVLKDNDTFMHVLLSKLTKGTLQAELYRVLQEIAHLAEGSPAEFIYNVATNLKLWKGETSIFLEEIQDWCESVRDLGEGRELVRVMTMNKAKGLSADYVFVVGLEDEVFPGHREGEELKDKSRLFYVTMTRARKELYLMWAHKRNASRSHIRLEYNETLTKSRFLNELPPDLVIEPDEWSR